MNRAMWLATAVLALAGCVSRNITMLQYYDISPKVVGAVVYSESHNLFGVNAKTIDRYLIDKDGNVQPIKQDSVSAAGAIAGIIQSAESSGAGAAAVTPIMGALFPATSKTTVQVGK